MGLLSEVFQASSVDLAGLTQQVQRSNCEGVSVQIGAALFCLVCAESVSVAEQVLLA